MTVETLFPLAATFPAGGSFNRFSFLLYGALVSTGLTLLASLQLVQIRLSGAGVINDLVPPASPGDLVVTTPAGIPALTVPQASAVNSEIALPLPVVIPLALPMGIQQPGQALRELRFIDDGGTVRQCYWDGASWLRVSNNVLVVTPGPPTPGYRGAVVIPLPP